MAEREVTPETVEREHSAEINQGAHWVYIAAVLGIGLVAMLALMALLERMA
jgi:hypothetical protein